MKCHNKNSALYGCSHVPKNFFSDMNRIACEIGFEIEKRHPKKFKVVQCKEKFGSIRVYYSWIKGLTMVNEGKVHASLVWIAKSEDLLKVSEKEIFKNHKRLLPKARKLLLKFLNKKLPKSERILFKIRESDGIVSNQEPKEIHEILEEFRYRYPEYAHYIYLFAPYECSCNYDDPCHPCDKYASPKKESNKS